ncbi:uncharacterized protein BDZ99DRAFT_461575 [Mytilinidion resinicola]|uniref:Uncharacterized protein n=1 Tax=Mytilinidion resinicola TaxID=574789 RepID=A0A6A6YSJ0_9PEZI|nr:uncharacterized protein BDZ99DRAFT_461575 [Mytilinidion resinicola]KAF2811518.1 hypothetical protein BDZ99DRAFT_461575 [Mytilinidion resinicola]
MPGGHHGGGIYSGGIPPWQTVNQIWTNPALLNTPTGGSHHRHSAGGHSRSHTGGGHTGSHGGSHGGGKHSNGASDASTTANQNATLLNNNIPQNPSDNPPDKNKLEIGNPFPEPPP